MVLSIESYYRQVIADSKIKARAIKTAIIILNFYFNIRGNLYVIGLIGMAQNRFYLDFTFSGKF